MQQNWASLFIGSVQDTVVLTVPTAAAYGQSYFKSSYA